MIQYENKNVAGVDVVRVTLDGRFAGFIQPEENGNGFYYATKSSRGETFPSIAAVKRSLEAA